MPVTLHSPPSVGLGRLAGSIVSLTGVGADCAHYIAWRLGEPDVFPTADLALRAAITEPVHLSAVPGETSER